MEEDFTAGLGRWLNISFYLYKNQEEWLKHFEKTIQRLTPKHCKYVLTEAVRWVRPDVGLFYLKRMNEHSPYLSILNAILLVQDRKYERAEKILCDVPHTNEEISIQIHLYLWALNLAMGFEDGANKNLMGLVKRCPSYLPLSEIFIHKNQEALITGQIRKLVVHTLISMQAWTNELNTFLYDERSQSLPIDRFPSFRLADEHFLLEIIKLNNRRKKISYPELIFMGWASLKLENNHDAFYYFQKAKVKKPQRLEHIIGLKYFLEKRFLNELNEQNGFLDRLLLTF